MYVLIFLHFVKLDRASSAGQAVFRASQELRTKGRKKQVCRRGQNRDTHFLRHDKNGRLTVAVLARKRSDHLPFPLSAVTLHRKQLPVETQSLTREIDSKVIGVFKRKVMIRKENEVPLHFTSFSFGIITGVAQRLVNL